MTRCDCHDVAFEDVARAMRDGGRPLRELQRVLPCAQTCTACLPDLEAFLRRQNL
jgi:bacterioferritin-associated ferredoxin